MYDVAPLFTPLQVKNKTLRNRIVLPPMVVNRPLNGREGWEWYGRRAAGGVGLAIVEAANSPLFGKELTAANLRPLADAIHQGGALAAIQIFPFRRGQTTLPADLSKRDIETLVSQFRLATEICAQAGFDGVEPHGAHGYLLNQFFWPAKNERSDEYGAATMEGRMRLALEIVAAIRPIIQQAGMLLLYRHTPVRGGLGYTIDDSLILAGELVKAGVDILDISPASDMAPADRAAPFMRFGVPVIGVNLMDDVSRALEALNEKRATLIAVGRGLIADPDWPNKVRDGRLNDIVACVRCDQCHADLRQGIPVGCPEWFGAGRKRA
jgi:2,4-dienoyl-CoA reductase-like NADH-dependent reductase (Old Yellow Enzyme family)